MKEIMDMRNFLWRDILSSKSVLDLNIEENKISFSVYAAVLGRYSSDLLKEIIAKYFLLKTKNYHVV